MMTAATAATAKKRERPRLTEEVDDKEKKARATADAIDEIAALRAVVVTAIVMIKESTRSLSNIKLSEEVTQDLRFEIDALNSFC